MDFFYIKIKEKIYKLSIIYLKYINLIKNNDFLINNNSLQNPLKLEIEDNKNFNYIIVYLNKIESIDYNWKKEYFKNIDIKKIFSLINICNFLDIPILLNDFIEELSNKIVNTNNNLLLNLLQTVC